MDRNITVVITSLSKFLHGCLVQVKNIVNHNCFTSIFTCLIALHDFADDVNYLLEQEIWSGDDKNSSIEVDCTESIEIGKTK